MILDLPRCSSRQFSCFFYGTASGISTEAHAALVASAAVMALGIGLAFSNARAVLEALFGIKSDFIRTPNNRRKESRETGNARSINQKRGLLLGCAEFFCPIFLLAVL